MGRLKILSAFGTRPEAVKMAPLLRVMKREADIEPRLCVTAQHRRMLDDVLEMFAIRPDYDLDIMKAGQTLTDITTRVIAGMERVLAKAKPDLLLVHGDTTTSFAAALAAYYAGVPVGHVEAGLRTYDKTQPFPEEMNRRLIAPIAELNFAPTQLAKRHLSDERVEPETIFVTGNTALDVFPHTVRGDEYRFAEESLNGVDFKGRRVIAMTAHRRENLGKPLDEICRAVRRLTEDFPDVEVVYAVHPNPAVRGPAHKLLGSAPRVRLVDALGLNDMHNLLARSYIVLTDSGGLQEEAPYFDKPVLVLRNVTERSEGVETGALQLVGTKGVDVYNAASRLLTDAAAYAAMAAAPNPFGDGMASRRITDAILYKFGRADKRPEDFAYYHKG